MSRREDDLAYGDYHPNARAGGSGGGGEGGGEKGLVGDTFKMLKDTYKNQSNHGGPGQSNKPYPPSSSSSYTGQSQPSSSGGGFSSQQQGGGIGTGGAKPKPDKLSEFLDKLQGSVADIGSEFAERLGTSIDPQGYAHYGATGATTNTAPNNATGHIDEPHRFGSFAPTREGNDVKWYVDGCNYFYAISKALENAKESIWILDWWLSPELYLRRPPAKNEQYRVDRILQAAAQRGVKVNIIVYKEVTQALTLSSSHTKHALEDLHPNIAVFRHPDHIPDGQALTESITSSLQNMALDAAGIAKLHPDSLKGLYGMSDDMILYWAHHEKLCLIDGRTAFMGGLDMCYGRWDTNQHFIADVHPTNLNENVYPGQDYNNARVLDFQDVVHWENNQLDRKETPRMGWSDISVSLHGVIVEDLRRHFLERWNFIYDTKYESRKNPRYYKLPLYGKPVVAQSLQYPQHNQQQLQQSQQTQQPQQLQQFQQPPPYQQHQLQPQQSQQYQPQQQPVQYYPPGASNAPSYESAGGPGQLFPPPPPPHPGAAAGQAPYYPPQPPQQEHQQYQQQSRGLGYNGKGGDDGERGLGTQKLSAYGNVIRGQLAGGIHQYQDRLSSTLNHHQHHHNHPGGGYPAGVSSQQGQHPGPAKGPMTCQIVRSCSRWSHGVETEHSVADAYAAIIRDSQHFIYMENQFFITATSDEQKPVQNRIGSAIVERILRAARAGQKYKIIVVIPSVPAFAGDLRDDSTLGTRAIMEFQYNSINRGGHSIMELVAKEGYNPMDYIRFYNLRNYDRINISGPLLAAQQGSGVNYEDARKAHETSLFGHGGSKSAFDTTTAYQQAAYQVQGDTNKAPSGPGRWDSVSECYMLGGEDIRNVPWEGAPEAEIDAFVSEELYVHSKVLIADDRLVICGSANMNDRSQLGTHDSEIAIIIEDHTPIASTMNGRPWTASRFASSLRRELTRKHLGLLPAQDYQRLEGNINAEPVGIAPNRYDFESPESRVVGDPLADSFQSLWNSRARTNTEVFRRVFHAVPDDTVRSWDAYKEFFEYYFRRANKDAQGKEGIAGLGLSPRYEWGHVVRGDFADGAEGVRQVKELLSQVKGTVVEMPLMFLIEEDVAKEGLTLNEVTEPIYT